jgi:hypothetical protein
MEVEAEGCDTEIHKEGSKRRGGFWVECWGDGVLG